MINIRDLLPLQEIDNSLLRIQKELDDLPRQATLHKAKLNLLNEEKKKLDLDITQFTKDKHARELELKTKEEEIRKLQGQQFTVKSNELYAAILADIAKHQKNISILEDQVLSSMDTLESLQTKLQQLKKSIQDEEVKYKKVEERLEQEKSRLSQLLEETKKERESMRSALSPDLMRNYDRIIKRFPGHAVVPVQGNSCGGCSIHLADTIISKTRRQENLIYCENCGRLLFYNEETQVL